MTIQFSDNARLQWLPLKDKVLRYTATVECISQDEFLATTYLLTDIICLSVDDIFAEHCWINDGSQIRKMNLKSGDIIEFDSKVHIYLKNGFGKHQRADLALSTPKNIKVNEEHLK